MAHTVHRCWATSSASSCTRRSSPSASPRSCSPRYSLDLGQRKALYTEATRIIHEDKPWLKLFQEVVVYGVSKRVTFKPRADYRLIVSEMSIAL
jgi:hypothetical protein